MSEEVKLLGPNDENLLAPLGPIGEIGVTKMDNKDNGEVLGNQSD